MEAQSSIRIIGGKWRSRKVIFMTKDMLRPTPDRVRETLFNWLAPDIVGAQCLDLYAGSGVLGLEALSRGAQSVVALERDPECYRQILAQKEILQASGLEVLNRDVLEWLQNPKFSADIIFVDPPYKLQILNRTLQLLAENNWLKLHGLVYFEQDTPLVPEQLPSNWSIWRSSKAGKVYYCLVTKDK